MKPEDAKKFNDDQIQKAVGQLESEPPVAGAARCSAADVLIEVRREADKRIALHKIEKPRDVQGFRELCAVRNAIQKCITAVLRVEPPNTQNGACFGETRSSEAAAGVPSAPD